MRKFTFNRKTIYITEKEWRALLDRWDASRAKANDSGKLEIDSRCIFCKINNLHHANCVNCPLNVFDDDESHGCVTLVRGLVRKYGNLNDHASLYYSSQSIEWFADEDKQARRAIQAIRTGILSAVKVSRRGE